ncbi:E3 ubiquitin-protein ligase RNF125-like [Oppia nitens]|uniref:E3 ubiquitin-protein ligase RNF125-like n=1 Tax=Oppia nitens TaxID=1686743 RepID=UPI0023DCB7AE|nr:E3 ubiquitin-protein ligase RNF125-like [Oppia nitens]
MDISRFVDLQGTRLARDLTCPICLLIFDQPMTTRCGHTFCADCIGQSILAGRRLLVCPQCGRTTRTENQWCLLPNTKIGQFIDGQRISCTYAAKGCPVVVLYGQLRRHLLDCRHNPYCYRCGPKCTGAVPKEWPTKVVSDGGGGIGGHHQYHQQFRQY